MYRWSSTIVQLGIVSLSPGDLGSSVRAPRLGSVVLPGFPSISLSAGSPILEGRRGWVDGESGDHGLEGGRDERTHLPGSDVR